MRSGGERAGQEDDSTYLIKLLWGLSKLIYVKCSGKYLAHINAIIISVVTLSVEPKAVIMQMGYLGFC